MDADRFDTLARSLTSAGTRRRLLALLTALPLAGALTTVLDEEGAATRGRHNRHAHNHRHSGHRKEHRKGERKEGNNDDDRCARVLRAAGCGLQDGAWRCPATSSLHGANLAGCTLSAAILINIDLSGAILRGAVLQGAIVAASTLVGADLSGANLFGAALLRADVTNVIWNNTTCPDSTNSNRNGGTCCGHMNGINPRAGC